MELPDHDHNTNYNIYFPFLQMKLNVPHVVMSVDLLLGECWLFSML